MLAILPWVVVAAWGVAPCAALQGGRGFLLRPKAGRKGAAPVAKGARPEASAIMSGAATAVGPKKSRAGRRAHARGLPFYAPLALAGGAALILGGAPAFATATVADSSLQTASVLDSGFLQATSLIFLSEIGDKTFFIASILAAKASRLITFIGSFGALVLMTVISVAIGQIFHAVPESFTGGLPLDDYVAIASFIYFGVKSLSDALTIDDDDDGLAEELREAEAELDSKDSVGRTRGRALALAAEAFTLTVVAEIGDRSQIATIALSAAQNPFVVGGGACLGHGLATGIAVLGGSVISKYVSEKGILLIAGVLFLVFAATTALPLVTPFLFA